MVRVWGRSCAFLMSFFQLVFHCSFLLLDNNIAMIPFVLWAVCMWNLSELLTLLLLSDRDPCDGGFRAHGGDCCGCQLSNWNHFHPAGGWHGGRGEKRKERSAPPLTWNRLLAIKMPRRIRFFCVCFLHLWYLSWCFVLHCCTTILLCNIFLLSFSNVCLAVIALCQCY